VQLISNGTAFKAHLTRLFAKYPQVSLAVAWASASTDAFKSLVAHKAKVQHAVIGTHFYQTHPDVLDSFVGSATTKFMLQPAGVFHPKVYCFHDGTSSRLLALKRPDYFICVDSKNRDKLTEEFDIRKSGLDYERYWFEIVGRLIDTPWWKSLPPSDPVELEAWQGRAAMLDALFYVD